MMPTLLSLSVRYGNGMLTFSVMNMVCFHFREVDSLVRKVHGVCVGADT